MSDPWAEFQPISPAPSRADPWAEFKTVSEAPPTPAGTSAPVPGVSFAPAGTGLMDLGSFDPAEERDAARRQGDLVKAAASGATLGYAPRLGAFVDSDQVGRALGTAGPNTPTYDQALKARTDDITRIRTEMPAGAKVAEGVGGMIGMALPGTPLANAARGLGFAGRSAVGAGTGATIGAVQGASDSKDLTNAPETASAALTEARRGAAFGAGFPIAGALIGRAYEKFAPMLFAAPPGMTRTSAALLANATGPNTVPGLERLGPHGMIADTSPSALGLTQGVASKSGPGADMVVNALESRAAGQSDRLLHSLDENLGPAMSPRQAGTMMDARQAAASPFYEEALNTAPHVDISPVIQQFENARLYAKGTDAARLDRMRTLLDGPQRVGAAAMPEYDARALHRAKMEMDAQIEGVHNQTGSAAATATRDMVGVRSALNQALEDGVPGYARANLAWGAAERGREAFDAGRQALKSGQDVLWPQDLAHEFAALPIERQALYRSGARSDIEAGLGNNRNDLSALNKVLGGENDFNRPKMATLFGEDQAANVVRDVNRERQFANTHEKTVSGSQSAQRLANNQAIDAAEPRYILPKGSTMTGLLGHGSEYMVRKAFGAMAKASGDATRDALARVLISGGPEGASNINELARALRGYGQTRQTISDALSHRAALVGALHSYPGASQP